jgi:hypothetical protein
MDQCGAMFGPLAVAAVPAYRGDYHLAFALLAFPAAINLSLVVLARFLYPRPQDLETEPRVIETTGLSRVFWIYLAGAALVAAGFADYPIIAYHLDLAGVASGEAIAIFYAVAMAVSGTGSCCWGACSTASAFPS